MSCVNCGKGITKEEILKRVPTCSKQCLDEAFEFDFLFRRFDWSTAMQHWLFCAERRGEVINEV